MFIKFLVLAAAVFSTCQCQLDSLCPNILNDITTCAADTIDSYSELRSKYTSAAQVLNFQTSIDALSIVCSHLTPIQNFYRCFYAKLIACVPPEWTKALPTTADVIDSITYICNNAADIDLECVITNAQPVVSCVTTALEGSNTNLTTVDSYVSYLCKALPLTENCYKSVLSTCTGRTAEILAGYVKYQLPAACDATIGRVSLALLVISLCYTWIKNLI